MFAGLKIVTVVVEAAQKLLVVITSTIAARSITLGVTGDTAKHCLLGLRQHHRRPGFPSLTLTSKKTYLYQLGANRTRERLC